MARSLNGGERSPRPVKPLRYRIDPTAEKLDALDTLERELERDNKKGMPSELYHELLGKLQADRAAIIKRRDKGKPEEEKDYESMPFTPSPPRHKLLYWKVRNGFTVKHYEWILFFVVLCWMLRK
jgi:hypothetical protein